MNRRNFLKISALTVPLTLIGTLASTAYARIGKAFDTDEIATTVNTLFGQTAKNSDKINLKVPEIAENGAVVPITVSTDLADVESIAILAKENPKPLVAYFKISSYVNPKVSTRIKMGKTSKVLAVVKTKNGTYQTEKEVKVTIGGCGG